MSWSSGDSPELSFDEPFCISERGCDNLLRRLTASDADVDQLDALLETVRFDANKDEWLTLLRLDDVFATGVFDDTGALIGVSSYAVGFAVAALAPLAAIAVTPVASEPVPERVAARAAAGD